MQTTEQRRQKKALATFERDLKACDEKLMLKLEELQEQEIRSRKARIEAAIKTLREKLGGAR